MSDYSFLTNAHPTYIEALYLQYQQNPASVDSSWAAFFYGFDYAEGQDTGGATSLNLDVLQKEIKVRQLIYGYRSRGHLVADTNPIRKRRDRDARLNLADFGLSEADYDTVFRAGEELDLPNATLRAIESHLRKLYCGHIGFEYVHIENRERRRWLRDQIEKRNLAADFGADSEKKKRILHKINDAVLMENFLAVKYTGAKRFGLEGGETSIAALDAIINAGVEAGVREVVIGMAHRGRLNVLTNVMQKPYEQLFAEFDNKTSVGPMDSSGDVKYHLGYSSNVKTASGKEVALKLLPNPSHLEAVNPVVEGYSRAKIDTVYGNASDVLPILIHGDAALAGQGILFEVIQMSRLEGYATGGTVHFVINNQVGFTTDFDDARSSTYSTGVAQVVQSPTFHVNGDDPEAVVFAAELATAYRQRFACDSFVDMVCYRKNGHNEGDNATFTQFEMTEVIKIHDNPLKVYSQILTNRGEVTADQVAEIGESFTAMLQERLDYVRATDVFPNQYQGLEASWDGLNKTFDIAHFDQSPTTGISTARLDYLINYLLTIPEDIVPVDAISRLIKGYEKQRETGKYDWSIGELLAYASVLQEGHDVRMSGQDVKRGTFTHRHAVILDTSRRDSDNELAEYNRLDRISDTQGKMRIYNSLLSEYAVLGFEYGYSLALPNTLTIWEAQFGDFANGAQTMIDQFIASGESKWGRMSGLVMLLPHGYTGQGPEHSSARLERFLQLCGDLNMVVTNITTAANFFHALRRQLTWTFRKPLINMSTKTFLRGELAASALTEFAEGTRFQEVIDDASAKASKVKRLLLCSGKVYYDLLAYQAKNDRQDVAIVRIEQLYPYPEKQVAAILKKYSKADVYWVQEESKNMGAWMFLHTFCPPFAKECISRPASASPAVGSLRKHEIEQADLVARAFGA